MFVIPSAVRDLLCHFDTLLDESMSFRVFNYMYIHVHVAQLNVVLTFLGRS